MSGRAATVDRRAVAWLRFVDAATHTVLATPVAASAEGTRLVRKPGGDVIVFPGSDLAAYDSFDLAPGAPLPPATLAVDIVPADGRYGPRRLTLRLPRDGDPANADQAGSLFRPAIAQLYPAAGYALGGQLAGVRVTLRRAADGARIEGGLLRLRVGGQIVARALSDAAGEALLVANGILLATPGPSATVLADVAGAIDAVVDPALSRFAADDAVAAARAAAARRTRGLVDPDDLETRLGEPPGPATAVRVRAGAIGQAALGWQP